MKLLTKSGLAGTLSVTDGLSGVGPPPGLTRSHVFAIWMYPGAPLLSPLLRNATSEDRFVKSFGDTPARSARAKATIRCTRPWESDRIGKIEKQIDRTISLGSLGPQGKREFTTGELARGIYAHPT